MGCRWMLVVAAAAMLPPVESPAEVKVVAERNEAGAASPAFRFKTVPAPSRTDAANKAKLAIVDGRSDPAGAGLAVLNDGRLPAEEDEPGANFFFGVNTDGGRLLIDLGEATEIKQVNTYSWHPGNRGPQVYKLYAADGSAEGFEARPARPADPRKAGWKLIASIDTRPQGGEAGGQYGVSVADSAGGSLGKYRWLLLDISRTEDDTFANTFWSEIDVSDGKEHAPPAGPATASAPAPSTVTIDGKYEITFDVSEAPDLQPWVETKLKPICVKWYPMIVEMLPSEGYAAPRRLSIAIRNAGGVAATGGTRITCSAAWFRRNLDGEAAGAVVHELVHVVQQYRRVRGGSPNPGWLVEGLADYIRWFLYEPAALRPRPNPARAKYTDSYRTTGAFLNYVVEKADKDAIKKLNAAMRQGKYSEDLWKQYAGKTVDELWADYVKTLTGRPASRPVSSPATTASGRQAPGAMESPLPGRASANRGRSLAGLGWSPAWR